MKSKLNKSRGLLSAILAAAIVFVMFTALSLTAYADSAAKIADMINDYTYFGSGALSAEVSGNTVTVTGTATSRGRKDAQLEFRPRRNGDMESRLYQTGLVCIYEKPLGGDVFPLQGLYGFPGFR